MNRMGAWGFALVAVIAVMVPDRAPAQDIPQGLRACATEADDAVRLKCYDSEVRRLPASTASTQAGSSQAGSKRAGSAQSAPPVAAQPVMTPEQAFGYSGAIAREGVDRRNEQRNTLDRIEVAVTKVEKKPLGEFVLTLENGQVWAQKSPEPGMRPKVGDTVTIRRASLGSFLLTASNGRSTQVSRVR
jgi:hypothetical protein